MPPGFQPAGRAPAPPPLDLVQDFVNTEIAVWAIDDIATPEALSEWLRARDLLDGAEVVGADGFVRARALRRLLRELASVDSHAVGSEQLHHEFAAIAVEARLRFELDGHGRLEVVPAGAGADAALGEILSRVHAAQLDGTWRRLKSCPGPHCGWLFYDGSRNVSSRWCSMSICGNRTKTAAYRRRRRSES